MKYTVKDLRADFPDEDACLLWLVEYLYPEGITCKTCERVTKHHKLSERRVYSCDRCGTQVSPTAGTIFHGSRTPLTDWFYAIYLMSTNKAGTSAKQIERELGCTYKTAWRMMHQIRKMMDAPDGMLEGEVELDETYVHANVFKRSSAKRRYGNTGQRGGEIIFGMVQRNGIAKVWHVKSSGARSLMPHVENNIRHGTIVHTDGFISYKSLTKRGYEHRMTNHNTNEFYREDSYTQNVENMWSHFKRGVKGVYRVVSKKYLQAYADEFAWRYSNRKRANMFWALMCRISRPG